MYEYMVEYVYEYVYVYKRLCVCMSLYINVHVCLLFVSECNWHLPLSGLYNYMCTTYKHVQEGKTAMDYAKEKGILDHLVSQTELY